MSDSERESGVTGEDAVREGAVRGLGRTPAQIAASLPGGHRLTPEQEAIVGAGLEPMLVVAGAGSGKTETLSHRILYLLDNGQRLFGRDISPDEILCLTFTRKAASEIATRANERIAQVYGADPARPEVSVATYNGYAAALVGDHGLRVAVDPESTVLTDAALWQLAVSVVDSWTQAVDTASAVSTVTAAIPRLAAQMRDHQVTPQQLREWARTRVAHIDSLPKKLGDPAPGDLTQELAGPVAKVRTLVSLADLVEEFDRRKREGSLLDFSDQVEIAVRLAALAQVKDIESATYRAVLLDEFQDTSPPQLQLFATLFGDGHPVMAVGDPHQAIYGFRGASADALARFVEAFASGGREVVQRTLSVSWRNSAAVLEAANASVAALDGGSVVGVPLRSKGEELGLPEPALAAPGVIAARYVTDEDEARAVAAFIAARRSELGHRPDRPVTAAVLCRRRAQYAAIATALEHEGIDYEIVGLGGLLDVPEVTDLLALLEVAHDLTRGDSLMRLLAGERINLGPRDLAALWDWAEEIAGPRDSREVEPSIVDALAQLPRDGWTSRGGRSLTGEGRRRLAALAEVIDSIRRHAYLALPELLAFAERAWGLDIEAAVARPDGRARRAVDAFIDAARTFAVGAEHATLGALLAWLDAARSEERGLDAPVREPDDAAVQLITIHGAKGLEWDIAVVPGLNDGHLPSLSAPSASSPEYTSWGWLDGVGGLPHELRLDGARLPVWDATQPRDHGELKASLARFRSACGAVTLDEERRLFYVALTRARFHVLLSGSWHPHVKRPTQPSIYLRELLDAAVVARGHWDEAPEQVPDFLAAVAPLPWPPAPTAAQQARREVALRVEAALAAGQGGPSEDLPWVRELSAMLAERAARRSQPVELPAHLATSALVALRRDREAFMAHVRRPMPAEPTFAAQQGSELHHWIERHFGHVTLLDDDDLASGVLGPDESGDRHLDRLKATFEASEWAVRTPTAIEVDVELPVGGVTVRSRIDAVFPPGAGLDRVTVVDWKSGRPPQDAAERAAREVQLAVYRLAWSQWKGLELDEVDAAFYYVDTDQTVRPERLLTREQIEALLAGEL